MLDGNDRKFLTWWFIGVAVISILAASASYTPIKHPGVATDNSGETLQKVIPFAPGDTPVVLVGDSLIFKSGGKANQPWMPVAGGQEYSVDPTYPISAIVVKRIAVEGGDANASSDKIRVDISLADSWEIDAFAKIPKNPPPAFEEIQVASLTPKSHSTEIHLVRSDVSNGAKFCNGDNVNEIKYGHSPDCSDKLTFSKIVIKVNGLVSGSLNCLDDAVHTEGKCRIVLRGPPSS